MANVNLFDTACLTGMTSESIWNISMRTMMLLFPWPYLTLLLFSSRTQQWSSLPRHFFVFHKRLNRWVLIKNLFFYWSKPLGLIQKVAHNLSQIQHFLFKLEEFTEFSRTNFGQVFQKTCGPLFVARKIFVPWPDSYRVSIRLTWTFSMSKFAEPGEII